MNCAEAPLIELLKAELDQAETETVLGHLDACGECRDRLRIMAALAAGVQGQERQTRTPRRKYWLLAASILLVLLLPILYRAYSRTSIEDLATDKSYTHFPLLTRDGAPANGDQDSIRAKAYEAYVRGAYPDAEKLLRSLPETAETTFYIGVCQYFQEKLPEAAVTFQKAVTDPGWRNQALWYQASVFLKLKRQEQAALILKQVADTPGEFSKEARDLLRKIEK